MLALLVLAFPAYVQVARSLVEPHPRRPRLASTSLAERELRGHECAPVAAVRDVSRPSGVADDSTRSRARCGGCWSAARHLLEWVSADRLAGVERTLATVAGVDVGGARPRRQRVRARCRPLRPTRLPVALPLIVLWLLSPAIALPHRASRRLGPPGRSSDADRAALRKVARKTWRFFEELLGTGRSLADSRQLSGGSRGPHRPPDVADQHRPPAARPRSRPTISDTSAPPAWSSGSSRRSPRCCSCRAIAATSTTGTTPGRWRRSCRPTSRRSTAATWPATCSRCKNALTRARTEPNRSSTAAALLEGSRDALDCCARRRGWRRGRSAERQPSRAATQPRGAKLRRSCAGRARRAAARRTRSMAAPAREPRSATSVI